MEKILLAIDAICPNKNSLDFACYLAQLTKSSITGVFLENLESEERPVLKLLKSRAYVDWEVNEQSEEHLAKMQKIEESISSFKECCITMEVNYSLHRDRGVPAHDLVTESRFADILIVDADTSFNKRYKGTPSEFVRNILKKAECPVIVAPENFDSVDEVVFTYNGSASSLFAIKQFTYLFPQLNKKKVSIIQVNEEGEWHDPDKYKFKEWLKEHYTDLHFEALKGNGDTIFFDYLFKRENIFLVMGAYGRNSLSRFFKASRADRLIKTIAHPIFIAHL